MTVLTRGLRPRTRSLSGSLTLARPAGHGEKRTSLEATP
jgi:hypothetical protein